MGYYHGEQSVGLKPILLSVSAVALLMFGCGYFFTANTGQAPVVPPVEPQLSDGTDPANAPAVKKNEEREPAVASVKPPISHAVREHVTGLKRHDRHIRA